MTTGKRILEAVAITYGITVYSLLESRKSKLIAQARYVAIHFLRQYCELTDAQIGEIFQHDRTIRHASQRYIADRTATEPLFREHLALIASVIDSGGLAQAA